MTSWICHYCGGRVYGFEGERGAYVGVCKHCGQSYGLTRGTDKEARVRYRLNEEVAKLDREAYRSYLFDDDHEAKWYINIIHHSKTTPIHDKQMSDNKIVGTFREAKDYAQGLSRKLDLKGVDAHVVVEIAYRKVAIYRNGVPMPIYVMLSHWTKEADPKKGLYYVNKLGSCVIDYSIERVKASIAYDVKNVKEEVSYDGPMTIDEYDAYLAEKHRQQREDHIKWLEEEIRRQEGVI